MTKVAEDLLLLLLDDELGRSIVNGKTLGFALAGAVLLDLVESQRVLLARPGEDARAGWLVVRDEAPTGDAVLDAALKRLGGRHAVKPQRAVERLATVVRSAVLDSLVEQGVLRAQEHKVLLFRWRTWHDVDPQRRASVRARLAGVLVGRERPDSRTVGLISVLRAIGVTHKVVAGDRRAVKSRATEVAAFHWAGLAVRKAVRSAESAAATAGAVAATAAAS